MDWVKVKEITEALKNLCTLALYGIISIFFIVVIWPKTKDFEIKELSVGGVKMGKVEKQALNTLEKVPQKVAQGTDTTEISKKYVDAAKIIDRSVNLINPSSQNWVYVGQLNNNKLEHTHFKISKLPSAGDVITAADAVYKRKDLPVELIDGSWRLGDIKGVVTGGQSVRVVAVQQVRNRNYWALVQ